MKFGLCTVPLYTVLYPHDPAVSVCRVQELEARVSSETARRQGAEEDARRSQEMEQRRQVFEPP